MADSTRIREYLDIPYLTNPDGEFHKFDLYVPELPSSDSTAPPPLLIFIHGGAWRSEDKSEHALLARRLAKFTSFPVAVPNYRLTTSSTLHIRHPAHAEDLHEFLKFILDWPGPEPPSKYDPGRLYLMGHSCSTHMLMSIFLSPPPPTNLSTTPTPLPSNTSNLPTYIHPSLIPSTRLLSSIRGFILSEGIYDLDLLLRSFPGYKDWFVAAAFGDRDSYSSVNTIHGVIRPTLLSASPSPSPSATTDGLTPTPATTLNSKPSCQWLIIYSPGDTLVDILQGQGIVDNLRRQGASVQFNSTELTEEHNELLEGEVYPGIVARFVLACEGSW